MNNLKDDLRKHPFLVSMDSDHLEIIASCASPVRFDAGQMVYREGDAADQFFLITEGRVAIEIFASERGSLVIQTLGPGDVTGWSWLFPPYRRRFNVRAVEATKAIALEGKSLREKADADHRLGYELFKRFSRIVVDRLLAARLQILDMYGKRA